MEELTVSQVKLVRGSVPLLTSASASASTIASGGASAQSCATT